MKKGSILHTPSLEHTTNKTLRLGIYIYNLKPTAKVSNFIQNGQRDIFKLNLTLQHHQIIQKIVGIALPITEIEDSFCWGLNGSGSFSTKSAIWLAHGKKSIGATTMGV